MGILDSLASAAAGTMGKTVENTFKDYILPNEKVIFSNQVKEDFICLTDKRVIFVNAKLISSKKGISSVPYSKITGVNLEKGGMMTISKNIILWVGSKEIEIDLWDGNTALKIFNLINENLIK